MCTAAKLRAAAKQGMIKTMRRTPVLALVLLFALGALVPDAAARRRRRRQGGVGVLVINSMTTGAEVLIDGKTMGTIPLAKPLQLASGKHTLKMTLQGYTEYLDVFTIQRNKTTTLDVDLLPYAGVVQVTVNAEGARVFIDGKFVGTAPVEQEVLIGERAIRVRKAGYYEYIGKLNSVAGKIQRLHIKLKPMPVGTTPYRPPPPPPPKWYEKWYVWAGAAAGVAAVTVAIIVPVVVMSRDDFGEFCESADLCIRR
jgi:hypothetical protein